MPIVPHPLEVGPGGELGRRFAAAEPLVEAEAGAAHRSIDGDIGASGGWGPGERRRGQRVGQIAKQPEDGGLVLVPRASKCRTPSASWYCWASLSAPRRMLLAAARVGIGVVLSEGERPGVLRPRVVGQAQSQRGQGRAADGVVDPAIELAELGGAVLAEPVGFELGDARECR